MRLGIILGLLLLSWTMVAQDVAEGATLFRNYCKACHSIEQKLVGPALKDLHLRRDPAWTIEFIKNSQAMIAAGDSIGQSLFIEFNQIPMPNQNLTDQQISSVLAYIKAESEPTQAEEQPIKRPVVDYGPAPTLLQFDNYLFWIPFTIAVIMLITMLYYMTVVYDFSQSD